MVTAESHADTMRFGFLGPNRTDEINVCNFSSDRNGRFPDGVYGTRSFDAVTSGSRSSYTIREKAAEFISRALSPETPIRTTKKFGEGRKFGGFGDRRR